MAEERLGQQHADFLAALQLAHHALVQRLVNAQPIEQHGRVGFRGVAVIFADDAFELAEAHAVGIGQLVVGLVVESFALLQRLPERAVAHDHGVDHALIVEGKLVLGQNAQLLGPGDVALGGLDLPGQNFHQGGFAGAIRPGNAITAASKEGGRDVLEEDPGPIAHRNVVNR